MPPSHWLGMRTLVAVGGVGGIPRLPLRTVAADRRVAPGYPPFGPDHRDTTSSTWWNSTTNGNRVTGAIRTRGLGALRSPQKRSLGDDRNGEIPAPVDRQEDSK
jgi:hypothetical protein